MKRFITGAAALFVLVSFFGAVFARTAVPVKAVQEITQTPTQTRGTTPDKGATYNYTAQSGDSYTKIARKAVQTYGLRNKVNLSGAQIIFAETNLTQEASSPLLNLGQNVSVEEAKVKSWVEKAQKLTDSEKAAWDYYVQFVDFNTNAIGQS